MSPVVVGLTMTLCRTRHRWDISAKPSFALVAQGPQQRVASSRVDIEFTAGWLLYRDVDARAGPFITGISEDRQVF
jgi:hypothetical protein